MESPDWWTLAACAGLPLTPFFQSGPGKQALAVCAECPIWVREACLEEAVRSEMSVGAGKSYGVRGGKTAGQRQRLIRARRPEKKAVGDQPPTAP